MVPGTIPDGLRLDLHWQRRLASLGSVMVAVDN